jgi:hypothetical protein
MRETCRRRALFRGFAERPSPVRAASSLGSAPGELKTFWINTGPSGNLTCQNCHNVFSPPRPPRAATCPGRPTRQVASDMSSPRGLCPRPSRTAAGAVRVTRQVGQQFEELRGLADEEPVLGEGVDCRCRAPLFVGGRADDRDGRQLPAQERTRLRHDQVGLELLASEWRRIEVREYQLGIVRVGQRRERVRDRIACLVVPNPQALISTSTTSMPTTAASRNGCAPSMASRRRTCPTTLAGAALWRRWTKRSSPRILSLERSDSGHINNQRHYSEILRCLPNGSEHPRDLFPLQCGGAEAAPVGSAPFTWRSRPPRRRG